MNERSSRNLKVVEDCHALMLWIIPQIDKFPRQRKFTLGARLEEGLLDVMKKLIIARYQTKKSSALLAANSELQVVIHLWRLSFELKVINVKSYEYGAGKMVEIGRQIGGWQKHST